MDRITGPNPEFAREVDPESVRNFALSNGIDTDSLFETSAKTGINVSRVFERVAAYYVPTNSNPAPTGNINIRENQVDQLPKEKKCC